MEEIPHWRLSRGVRVVRSSSGVRVTTHPDDNLVRAGTAPWPAPELLQKYCARTRFRGATPEDDAAARAALGHYCDLQSLNSEDAVTWSVFGTLAYLPEPAREAAIAALFRRLDLPAPRGRAHTWLWRRLPHPQKPASNGGPEIDFGVLSDEVLVLGEAKWNSPLGRGQGIDGAQSQLDLRQLYCSHLARSALPHVHAFVVLGVARAPDLLAGGGTHTEGVSVRDLRWADVADCLEDPVREELHQYLAWRATYGPRAPEESGSAAAAAAGSRTPAA